MSQVKSRVRQVWWVAAVLLLLVPLAGCGEDDAASVTVVEGPGDRVQYTGSGTTVVVIGDETYVVTGDPDGRCVQIGEHCVDLEKANGHYCNDEDAQADVIVVDGEVVDVICYPAPRGTPIEEVDVNADGTVEVPQTANGAVIVFDDDTNGEPIVGDVRLSAERATIYGNGVAETIIDGNLTMESNNSRVRALTVTGNLVYTQNSNNSAASFCRVYGNLEVASNDFTLTNCEIFGSVSITGNNATLVNLGVGGDCAIGGGAECIGCYSISDDDGDYLVTERERGAAMCRP